MHWFGDYGMGYGYGGFFMIFIWVIVIVIVIYLVKVLGGNAACGKGKSESAEEVLGKRFARGEITKEEFEEAMEVLKKQGT